MLNLACSCGSGFNCFEVVKAPKGSQGNDLVPFVSLASNSIAFGKTVYIPKLNGLKLPNGKTHNGCTRVDDTCAIGCGQSGIDWYVVKESNQKRIDRQYKLSATQVDIQVKSCSVGRY